MVCLLAYRDLCKNILIDDGAFFFQLILYSSQASVVCIARLLDYACLRLLGMAATAAMVRPSYKTLSFASIFLARSKNLYLNFYPKV